MMTTNLFVIANVKQLRTGGSFQNFTAFFPNNLGYWSPKFGIFNSSHNRAEFGTNLVGLQNSPPLGTPLLAHKNINTHDTLDTIPVNTQL